MLSERKQRWCLVLRQLRTSWREGWSLLRTESSRILWWQSFPVSMMRYSMTGQMQGYQAWGGSKLIASRLGANPFDMGFLTSFLVPLICLPSISIQLQAELPPSTIYNQFLYISIMEPEPQEKEAERAEKAKPQPSGKGEGEAPVCQLYLTRKRRTCRFPAAHGSKYCAAHSSDLEGKVECPYEKGIFIAAKKMEKHLLNCPKVVNRKKEEDNAWFSKDINTTDPQLKPEACEMPNLSQVPEELMSRLVSKIVEIYTKELEQKDWVHFIGSSTKEELEGTTNDHLQAALIAEKAFEYKLIAPDFVYVEFGAGKGVLSYAIATKVEKEFKAHSKNILLERESRRNKFDRFFKGNPFFQRYKGDVSHFDFTALPHTMATTATQKSSGDLDPQVIEQKIGQLQLIGVCKHMCGEALDISMRGLLQGNVKGCILASCCHHLCRYQTYLNPSFFQKQGLTPPEIQILFRISSWGTKAHWFQVLSSGQLEELRKKGFPLLQPEQKILVGRMAKRLIDLGRAQFLEGKLYRYCSDQLTPENYVIISRT